MAWKRCKSCGQPMLPKGREKKPGEFDHASGCPLDTSAIDDRLDDGFEMLADDDPTDLLPPQVTGRDYPS